MLDTGKPVFSWAKQLKQEEQGDHGGSEGYRGRAGDMQWQSRLWQPDRCKKKQHQRGPPQKASSNTTLLCMCSGFVPRWNCKELQGNTELGL